MKVIGFYILSFASATALFIFLFHSPLLEGNIFFYRGVGLLAITSLVAVVLMLIFKKSQWGNFLAYKDILISLIIFSNLNMTFFTLVPVTVERSVSVWILRFLNRQESADRNVLTEKFIEEYVYKNNAMQKRIDEQEASGNLVTVEDEVKITDQGKALVQLYVRVAKVFNVGEVLK